MEALEYRLIVRTKPTDLFLAKVANLLTKGDHGWPNKMKYFFVINPDENSSGEPKNEPRPAHFDKEFKIKQFYFLPRGSINTTVRLEPDRIRPGQTIYSLLTFDTSKSNVKIEGVEVYISTIVDLFSGGRSRYRRNWFELKTSSIKGPPVPSGLKREVRPMSFAVPFNFPRSYKSEMMQVSHMLVVKINIPHSGNQKLRLPITVYGFSTPLQSRCRNIANEGKRDENIYIAQQLNNIINNADDPPPTFTEGPRTKI